MPNRNPQKQRESWKKWYLKNKDKYRKRKAIQAVARVNNKVRKNCSIRNCKVLGERHHPDYEEPKDIIWLCKKHHEIIHSSKIKRLCSIAECFGIHDARGWCKKHYDCLFKTPERRKKVAIAYEKDN